jgi:hypothetical protein
LAWHGSDGTRLSLIAGAGFAFLAAALTMFRPRATLP